MSGRQTWDISIARGPILKMALLLCLFLLVSCRSGPVYHEIPIPERKLNLLGLEMIATKYLNEHPESFYPFHRIITAADDALQEHRAPTRWGVMKWIEPALKREGLDETMPVYLFLRSVYLKGWEGAYLRSIDEGEGSIFMI